MGPVTAQLLDELGYDPDDGTPQLVELASRGALGRLAIGALVAARAGARRVAVARLGSGRLVVVEETPDGRLKKWHKDIPAPAKKASKAGAQATAVPSTPTSMVAPAGRGALRQVPTTVAMPTGCPSRHHRVSSLSTSRTGPLRPRHRP